MSGPHGPEEGPASLTRAGPARTGVFDSQDTRGLSLSEGVIIINGDVSAFDTAEKTDKVTTNVASDGQQHRLQSARGRPCLVGALS